MKNKLLLAALVCALLILCLTAQDDGSQPRPGPAPAPGQGPRRPPPVDPIVAALDTNHDGVIDANEIANASAALKTLDKNGDGKLTPDEYRPHPPERQSPPGQGRGLQGGPPGVSQNGGRTDDRDHGRPVELVARELGVTPDQFREAFKKVHPAGAGQEPMQEQRQANRKALSEALGVSPEWLDEVMDKYRPGGRGSNGPPSPPRDAAPKGDSGPGL
jgi:hypothetical protein